MVGRGFSSPMTWMRKVAMSPVSTRRSHRLRWAHDIAAAGADARLPTRLAGGTGLAVWAAPAIGEEGAGVCRPPRGRRASERPSVNLRQEPLPPRHLDKGSTAAETTAVSRRVALPFGRRSDGLVY